MSPESNLLERVVELLPSYAYRFGSEVDLHKGISEVLTAAGVEHLREHVASPQDRFDFLLPGGIVIEVKVDGSMPQALRQIDRYAKRDDVSAVVLATSRSWGSSHARPSSLHGKPVRFLTLKARSF